MFDVQNERERLQVDNYILTINAKTGHFCFLSSRPANYLLGNDSTEIVPIEEGRPEKNVSFTVT